jgi:hypothetical protein
MPLGAMRDSSEALQKKLVETLPGSLCLELFVEAIALLRYLCTLAHSSCPMRLAMACSRTTCLSGRPASSSASRQPGPTSALSGAAMSWPRHQAAQQRRGGWQCRRAGSRALVVRAEQQGAEEPRRGEQQADFWEVSCWLRRGGISPLPSGRHCQAR